MSPPKREDRVIVVPLPGGASPRYVRESELVGVMTDYQRISDASMRAAVRQFIRRLADAARLDVRRRRQGSSPKGEDGGLME